MRLPFSKVDPPKGARRLHLSNHELRRELIHADTIIKNACSVMVDGQREAFQTMNQISADAPPDDFYRSKSRHNAMHRTTPKCDYSKAVIIALALLCAVAWYCTQTENELLRAELTQLQAN